MLTGLTKTYGQEDLIYSGPLTVSSFQGNARYHYKIVDGDTLLNGSFQMQRSNLDALLKEKDSTFLFTGDFTNNFPNGDWRFQFGEYQSDSLTEVIGYQYKLNVNGTQEEAKGSMVMGKPDGLWVFIQNRIKNSEIEETLFKSTVQFDKGVPQKNFQIENVKGTLVGRFLRDGLAHDEWTLYSKDEIEAVQSWYFTDGRLIRIKKEVAGDIQEVSFYQKSMSNLKVINLDERYINILQLQQKIGDTSKLLVEGIPQLLAENASYYKKIDTIFSALSKSTFLPEFKVKVPYYPMDSLEKIQFESIKKNYTRLRKVSDSFLDNTQLNILKLSDQQALLLYNKIDTMTQNFIDPLQRLINYEKQDVLSFVPREVLLNKVWPGDLNQKGVNNIALLSQTALSSMQTLDSIQTILDSKLAREKRQREFVALEERMIVQIKNLNNLIDSVGNTLSTELVKALKNINSLANSNLSSYSNMTALDEKLLLGQNLVLCFDSLEQLEKVILKLPSQKQEITTAYQDRIWNPFMANLMNEDVKKRITNAYHKIWLPYLLRMVTSELNCGNAEELVILFSKTHERMLEMREEDTKKLERKLKREQDPLEVKKMLNLQTTALENK